jgi:DMSO/TMAO reductase YedYZ heme-binding membrane subunit
LNDTDIELKFLNVLSEETIINEQTTESKNAAGSIIVVVLMAGIGYSILRYHLVGSVPWKDLPFFILNKGVSLSAFILLTLNFGLGPLNNIGLKIPESWLNARKALGMTGFLLVLIHALISFMLFTPASYGKFFQPDGTLTLQGGLSMLAGILAFVVLWAYNMTFQTHLREDKTFVQFITSRGFMLFALLLGAFHLIFMGYEGWLNPAAWQGGLPPISLVAFIIFMVGYVSNLIGRK